MSYDSANKTSHIDIVNNPDVSDFLKECTFMKPPTNDEIDKIKELFINVSLDIEISLPKNIITIDSGSYEAKIHNDIPFTNIGYVKLVNSLLKKNELLSLNNKKFIDPFKIAELIDNNESTTFVLPSSNIKYKNESTTRNGFRLALDEYFENIKESSDDRKTNLKTTLFHLASYRRNSKPDVILLHKCPNCGEPDIEILNITESQFCPKCNGRIYATDSLRIHEEVDENSPSNKSALGRLEKTIRHIYLAHLIRLIEYKHRQNCLGVFNDIAFIINGPLSVAGNAAWVHGSLMKIINEVNVKMRLKSYSDLLVIGLVSNGLALVDYARLIEKHLNDNTLLCVSDSFRNKYVNFDSTPSNTTFGSETYYGQDFIWKSDHSVKVFDIPYPVSSKENLDAFIALKSDHANYNNLHKALMMINDLQSSLDDESIAPLIISKKYTTISLEPGAHVLDMLTKNNVI